VVGAESEHMALLSSSFLAHIGCKVKRGGTTAASVSRRVLEEEADIGVYFRADGEEGGLIDQGGGPVGKDLYLGLATWVALSVKGKNLVIPTDAPQTLWDMAAGRAEVVNVKSSPGEVMAKMQALSEKDRRVALQYLLNFDGIQAAAQIIDYLVSRNTSLGQVLMELPDLHFRKLAIPCQWEDKGRVLRELVAQYRPEEMQLDEGVKVLKDRGWALVLPDSERPQFNIYAQGYGEEFAEELAGEFRDKVMSLLASSQKN